MKKILIIFIIGIFMTSFVSAALADNIISYWSFEKSTGPVVDDYGANNGTNIGGTRAYQGILGNSTLYKVGNTVTLGNPSNYTAFNYSTFSMSFWVNMSYLTQNHAIIERRPDGANDANRPWTMQAQWGLNKFRFLVTNATASEGNVVTTGPLIANATTHIVVSRNHTTGRILIYVNGSLETNTTSVPGLLKESINMTLGSVASDGLDGTLDELAYWGNRIISQTEAASLYNGGLGAKLTVVNTLSVTATPTNNTLSVTSPISFNITSSPSAETNVTNTTLFIWNSDLSVFNITTKDITGDGVDNTTSINITFTTPKVYYWNVESCGVSSSGDICAMVDSTANRTLTFGLSNSSASLTSNVWETETSNWNATFQSSATPTANLWWNGTKYTATITNIVGDLYRAAVSFDLPLGEVGTKNAFFELINGALRQNTTTTAQTLAVTNISLCGSPYTTPYMNFTYKNETVSEEHVNASISEGTFSIWAGSGTVKRNITYSTAVESAEHRFCVTPGHLSVNADVSLSYANTYSEQRTYTPSTLSLTNGTTNQTLFLLPTSEGIFVTFQVVSTAGQTISGAQVVITRGSNTVSTTQTASSGTTSVFLDPDLTYTLTASKTGFGSFTTTQTFPDVSYTISLAGGNSAAYNSTEEGIYYDIYPKVGVINNQTIYNFNMSLTSSKWVLQEYGFIIHNKTGTVLGTASDTSSNGGFVNVDVNTGNNTLVIMNYYWKFNNSYTNRSISWAVRPEGEGSLLGFFTRLRAYTTGDGILGMNKNNNGQFTMIILLFLAIFLVAGVLSFKFGIITHVPIAIGVLLFVILLDMFKFFTPITGVIQGVIGGFAGLLIITILWRAAR